MKIKLIISFIITSLLFSAYNIFAEELKYKNLFIGWKTVEGAFGYRVEVKNNADEVVIANDVKINSINIRLPEGDFKLRIGAKNRQSRVENWSDWKDIKIVIKNPPPPPESLAATKSVPDKNHINIALAWNPPAYTGEGALSYSIFRIIDNNLEKAGETKETEYLFTGLPRGGVYRFQVFSVNTDGEESLKGLEISVDDDIISVNLLVKGSFIKPLVKFGDLFEYGFGSTLNLYLNNIFVSNLNAGIESGYLYLKGKGTDSPDHLNAESSYIIPACLNVSYNIDINDFFFIRPVVSSGYTYNKMEYKDDNNDSQKKIFWNPVINGGLDFLYKVNYYLALGIGCQYGLIFESKGILYFAGLNAGIDFRFEL